MVNCRKKTKIICPLEMDECKLVKYNPVILRIIWLQDQALAIPRSRVSKEGINVVFGITSLAVAIGLQNIEEVDGALGPCPRHLFEICVKADRFHDFVGWEQQVDPNLRFS